MPVLKAMSRGMRNGDEIRRSRSPRRLIRGTAAGILVFLVLCTSHLGRAQGVSEYQVKAAYLYNFAKLATWQEQAPGNASAPLSIGVVAGDDEFVEILAKTVDGKSAGSHPINVKRVVTEDDLSACRLLFVRASAGHKRTLAVIAAAASAGALVIGEDESFLREGGMINLLLENGKIRFAVNRDALDRAGIRLSPELLQLAKAEEGSRKPKPHGPRQLRESRLPEYPELARRSKLQGTVHLELDVRRDGTVKSVRVLGGHPVLAEALSQAVMEWKYEPAPDETVEQVNYTFSE